MSAQNFEKGFIPVVALLVVVAVVGGGAIASKVPYTTSYTSENVAVLGETSSRPDGEKRGAPEAKKMEGQPPKAQRLGDQKPPLASKSSERPPQLDKKAPRSESKVVERSGSESARRSLNEKFKIATEGGKPRLESGRVGALSHFPISIDPETNQLIITTPAGTKAVTVLPDKAVANMLSKGVLSKIVNEGSTSAGIANVVRLDEEDGQPVYKVKGKKAHKMFGFIPVETEVEANVSAESGELVSTEESFLSKIVDLVSPD
jgi:hypothetical protein